MDAVIKFIQKNTWLFTITIWVLGVAFAGFNLYISSQLTPLAHRLDTIVTRIEANDKKDEDHALFSTKEDILSLKEDIKEIKQDTRDIKNYLLNR